MGKSIECHMFGAFMSVYTQSIKKPSSQYSFDPVTLRPLNPIGRTGLSGRGLLGRWGPNHAADPIVSRTNDNGDLEFVAVQRHDNGEWAIPGGMVDAGEHVSQTLRREFAEEAMHGIVDSENLDELWNNGKELYRCIHSSFIPLNVSFTEVTLMTHVTLITHGWRLLFSIFMIQKAF